MFRSRVAMFKSRVLLQYTQVIKYSRHTYQLKCLRAVSSCSASLDSLRPLWAKPTFEVNTGCRIFHVTTPVWSLSEQDIKRHMDTITDKFTEAMELLSEARSSKGTVYFSEDMNEAESTIDDVLKDYKLFLGLLSEKQSRDVVRAIGLKMEELKAQLQLLKESIKD